MVENKQVMAENILYYMELNGVNARDVCKACGFKQNTFSDWVNAKTYPRIDKIELMAEYFHINKSCLVEANRPSASSELERVWNYCRQLYPDIKDTELYNHVTKAINMYEAYEHAPHDRQSIVDIALELPQQKS